MHRSLHPWRALLLIAAATTAAAAQSANDPDPASLLPQDFRVYVDVADLGRLLAVARALPPLKDAAVNTAQARDALRVFDDLSHHAPKRAALGLEGGDGKAWIFLMRVDDTADAAKTLKRLAGRGDAVPVRAGPYAGLCDSPPTLERFEKVAGREKASLLERDGFVEARKASGGGDVFLHVDLAGTRWLRLGAAKPKDVGQALLAAHLLSVAATADAVTARIDLDGGLRASVVAPIRPLGAERAFATSTRPTAPALSAPEGAPLRMSLRRDLAAFWKNRNAFVAEDARGGVAEFQNNLSILMGGLAAEDVFAGLGPAFDLYLGPPPASPPASKHRLPTLALVATVDDAALRPEVLLGFQTTIGVVNADAAQKRRPRFLLETSEHRGVRVTSARYLAELMPDQDDDRLQLRPSLAFIGTRLILGTHPDVVVALVDRALDGRETPREAGDALALDGVAAASVLRAALPFLASRDALEKGGDEAESAARLETIAGILAQMPSTALRFAIEGKVARLDLDLRAPALVPARPGTSR